MQKINIHNVIIILKGFFAGILVCLLLGIVAKVIFPEIPEEYGFLRALITISVWVLSLTICIIVIVKDMKKKKKHEL